jgi:hypothetical protein
MATTSATPDHLQGRHNGDRQQEQQEVPEKRGGQPEDRRQDRVKGDQHQLFVKGHRQQQHSPAQNRRHDQVGGGDAQDVAEEEVGEVHGVGAHRAEQGDAQGERAGEDNADGGILPDAGLEVANGRRGQESGSQRARAEGPPGQVGHRHAGQDGVGQSVAEEGHAPQHHVGP